MKKLLITLLSTFAPIIFAAKPTFTINNQPINPFCVWKSIRNTVVINLKACQKSRTDGLFTIDKIPTYHFPWGLHGNFNNKLRRGTFSYRYIGQTKNGLDVLHIFDFGGGTGIFDSILFLKRRLSTTFTFNKYNQWAPNTFTSLSYVGLIPGGDRASGSFKTIKIQNNQVTGIRYNPNNLAVAPQYPDQKFNFSIPKN